MLTFFRNFFKSKIGLAITLAFLGLIAFASLTPMIFVLGYGILI